MKKTFALFLALAMVLTLLPLSGLADREFAIDPNFTADDGYIKIKWTDSIDGGPYTVAYRLIDEDSDAQQALVAAGADLSSSTTSNKSFKFDRLIAGKSYLIVVFDANDEVATEVIQLPAVENLADYKLTGSSVKLSVEPRYMRNSSDSPQGLIALKASDIMAHAEDQYFGLRCEFSLPELAYDREYLVQIVLTAPNGYSETVHASQYTFGTGKGYSYYIRMLGSNFFYRLYTNNDVVPVGEYTCQMFLNGMLAATRVFKVK